MPAFKLSEPEVAAIVAFIHDQKIKAEALGGGRRSVEPADLATGNAAAGLLYFKGAGGCAGCSGMAGAGSGTGAAAANAGAAVPDTPAAD